MKQDVLNRGGAPVGFLSQLGPVEAGAVLYLRLWCSGARFQAQAKDDFAKSLGIKNGNHAFKSFIELFNLYSGQARRPLMHHDVHCKCLGADEACFANFIGYASEGDREDAFLLASTVVRPDLAPSLINFAAEFGMALKRMAHTPTIYAEEAMTIH